MMNKKRLLALLLAVVMVIGMIPTVWATDTETTEATTEVTTEATNEPVAVAAAVAELLSNDSGAVKLAKSAQYNPSTNKVEITLESYTTGEVKEGQLLAADTVLVLDVSGSMDFAYKVKRTGTPIYGDHFYHPSYNKCYWGWKDDGHLTDNKNPYVRLNGVFKEAEYATTDGNNVEVFRVKETGQLFYPTLKTESLKNIPREHNYPVYQLYSSTATETYNLQTGIPIFGYKFEAENKTWYGWRANTHQTNNKDPYIQLEDGSFVSVAYDESDSNGVEIFKYYDSAAEEYVQFYPRLQENCNNVTRVKNLPVLQLYKSYNGTRMPALQNAVAEFLRLTAKQNAKMPADNKNRVAMVQFSCNTAAHTSQETKIIKDFVEVTASNVDSLISFVYSITDGGAHTHTEIGRGMELAENLLGTVSRTSHKAVVAFTDGYPEACDKNGWGQADTAIAVAKRLTNSYNATIYSVCIQDDAVVNASGGLPENDTDAHKINRFMHLLSSNYPGASSMSSTGTGSTNSGYYLVPGSENDLTKIFTNIGAQIGGATVNLDASTIVKDYITPQFAIPENATVTIAVKDAYYENGTLKWKDSTMSTSGIKYAVDDDKGMVTVTGFDYNHNFVASTGRVEGNVAVAGNFHGRKLVVKFTVNVKPDFLGGNKVDTNEKTSGLYTVAGAVALYPEPKIDVTVNGINPVVISKDIYISQQASIPDVINIGKYAQNGGNWQVDGINNAFVDIVYTVNKKGAADSEAMTFTIPAGTAYDQMASQWQPENAETHPFLKEDTTYTVTCTVSPISQGTATPASSPLKEQLIQVYKPVITFEDQSINLGTTPNYEDDFVQIAWQNKDGVSANTSVMGSAPVVEYGYDPVADKFTSDTDVRVTVTAEGGKNNVPADMDITQYTTFWRTACNVEGCDHKVTKVVGQGGVNFKIHINKFDLTIIKKIFDNSNPDQSFMFRVTKDDDRTYVMEVVIPESAFNSGEASITIKDLIPGDYTVEELVDWSWRYTCDDAEEKVPATSVQNGKTSVTFTNKRTNGKWLSGDSWAKNLWNAENSNVQRIN